MAITPAVTSANDTLLARVRELRAAGRTPKQIARALGLRPAAVTPMVRAVAEEVAATEPEPPVVGCWVSPGWSAHLTIEGHEDDWPDTGTAKTGSDGLAGVLVARRHRPHRVSVCGYLVDTYCLGVKNALGPQRMDELDLLTFRKKFFSAFGADHPSVAAPLELARHLVWGAVDYARGLGFEPHPDFEAAAGHLGPWQETSHITFGRDGVPFYIAGPYDNSIGVLHTLNKTAQ